MALFCATIRRDSVSLLRFPFLAMSKLCWGSISGRVLPKTQKMVLDAALLSTQHCKGRIKGRVEQPREWSSALPYTLV